MMSKTSKKYTKRQILESIRYWQKQLKAGNYKRVNESSAEDLLWDNYDYMVYGEMNAAGSYAGREHWWLACSNKSLCDAMRQVLEHFCEEHSYKFKPTSSYGYGEEYHPMDLKEFCDSFIFRKDLRRELEKNDKTQCIAIDDSGNEMVVTFNCEPDSKTIDFCDKDNAISTDDGY